jgi:hypothetical protein
MTLTEKIKEYLHQYGWEYQENENDSILTQFMFEKSEEVLLMVIQISSPWLRIYIPLYLPILSENMSPELSRKLLEINYASRQVFFSINELGYISLCTDMWISNDFTYESFETSLDCITYLAEEAFIPLMSLM